MMSLFFITRGLFCLSERGIVNEGYVILSERRIAVLAVIIAEKHHLPGG